MNLRLEGVLVDNGRGWMPQDYIGWDIVDSDLRPGELAIAGGGHTDPDTFSELKKLNVNGGATTARASMPSH